MNTHLHKFDVSRDRQKLIDLMRQIGFGRIERLSVRNCEPVFDQPPTILREIKFGAGSNSGDGPATEDFSLKAKVIELLDCLDLIQDGVIDTIEVQNGLPFRMIYREDHACISG